VDPRDAGFSNNTTCMGGRHFHPVRVKVVCHKTF
jgi:hypothetical protein